MATVAFPDVFNDLFRETKRILADLGASEKGLQEIQKQVTRLATEEKMTEHPSFKELERRTAASLQVISSLGEDDLTLVAARFPPDRPTPIHNHTTWGVACVVKGRDRYIHWERLDDGSDPSTARLKVQYERILEPGDSVFWLDPPGDIHSQQGEGETALEVVLFGRNPQAAVRHAYNPETGQIRELST